MSKRTIKYIHEGNEYSGEFATVRSTSLGWEDHGIFTAYLHCEWSGSSIGVGGYCLDESVRLTPDSPSTRAGTAYGLDHIMRIMETVGVTKWEYLVGKTIIILFDHYASSAVGIAHPVEDKILILADHAKKWKEK